MAQTEPLLVDAPQGYTGPGSDAWFFGADMEPPFAFGAAAQKAVPDLAAALQALADLTGVPQT